MDKSKHFKLLIVLVIIMITNINNIKAQSSSSTANSIALSTPFITSTQTATSSEHWVSFTAISDTLAISVSNDSYDVNSINVYSNNSSSPIQIVSTNNKALTVFNLVIGSSYYIKFTSQNMSGSFSLLLSLFMPELKIERKDLSGNYYLMGNSEYDVCQGEVLKVYAIWNGIKPEEFYFSFDGLVPDIYTTQFNATHLITVPNANTTLSNPWLIAVAVKIEGKWYFFDPAIHSMHPCQINHIPNTIFTPTPNPACPLENVSANIQSLPPYSGDWGDGTVLTSFNGGNQPHPYQQTGIYNANISSTNMCGTSSSQTTINVEITPDFTFSNQCVGNTVNFNDITTCSSVIANWQWDFGDGTGVNFSSSNNPSHIYSNPGTYTVTLKVKTNYNAPSTGQPEMFSFSKQVTIYPKPEPALISGVNNVCDGVDDIQFEIDNYQNSYTYNWTITQGSGTFNNTTNTTANGQTNTVDWNSIPSLPSYAQLQIQTTDNNGCQSIASKNVFECCELVDADLTYNNVTLSGSQISYEGKRIMVNGTLTIDADVVFEDDGVSNIKTNVFMGPEAKIIVTSGHSVEFSNSIIQSNCDYMWDGIYVYGNTSSVEFDNSEMREALNGIVAVDAAVVNLKNSDFIDNYISVQINDYIPSISNPINYSGDIYGCNFYTKNAVINNGSWITPATDADYYLNLAPKTGKQAFAAIRLKKVGLINIGEASNNQNFFAKQQYGIYAETSEPTIRNNEFQYITKKYVNGQSGIRTKFPESAAIFGVYYYKKFMRLNIDNRLTVGDNTLMSGNYSNTIENCEVGILTKNYRNKIFKNKFLQTSNSAVYMYDMASGGDIQYNYISNNTLLPNARGIYGANTTQRKIMLNIENNSIYYMKWGVALTNASSFNFSNNPLLVQIHNNTIALNPIDNIIRYAIKVAACDRIEIRENTITRIGNPTASDATKVVGISLRQTQSAKVTDNYMFKMGSGIMTNGAMYNTQFFCNTFSHNFNGFYFGANTGLTNFGWKNVPNVSDFNPHNKWIYNIDEKMSNHGITNQTPVDYYYFDINWQGFNNNQTTASYYNPDITLGSSCYGKIFPVVNNSADFYCSNSNGPNIIINDDEISTADERAELLEEFLQGEEYTALQKEFRSYEIEYLYDILDNDTNIMWLGSNEDADYQSFYNTVKNSVNAKFIDVDNLIAEGNFPEAYTLNDAILPANNFEANRQLSNKIYLETYINDDYQLAETTISRLTTIASQTPYAGGYGVYTARVMLDYDPDENGVAWRLAPSTTSHKQETKVRVFPNPAKEVLYIEVQSDMDDYSASLKIYNSMGQLVAQQQLSQKMEFIDLKLLKTGVYFYNIQYRNGYFENGKFMVQK